MSGIKRLVQLDTKGQEPITNEMIAEEATESQASAEEVAEKKE